MAIAAQDKYLILREILTAKLDTFARATLPTVPPDVSEYLLKGHQDDHDGRIAVAQEIRRLIDQMDLNLDTWIPAMEQAKKALQANKRSLAYHRGVSTMILNVSMLVKGIQEALDHPLLESYRRLGKPSADLKPKR